MMNEQGLLDYMFLFLPIDTMEGVSSIFICKGLVHVKRIAAMIMKNHYENAAFDETNILICAGDLKGFKFYVYLKDPERFPFPEPQLVGACYVSSLDFISNLVDVRRGKYDDKLYVYRSHRGSLDESMETCVICESVDKLKDVVIEEYRPYGVTLTRDDIIISDETHNDERIGWKETRYVCVTHLEGDNFDTPQCVGMCCDQEHLPFDFIDNLKHSLEENKSVSSWSIRIV